MGRPYKLGLDYFTVDTDLDSDPKIQNLIREGETDAWAVYSWLWIKTYHDNYYIEKETLVRSIQWLFRSLTEERILECLDILVGCKLINKKFYEQGIITGRGIQKRYWEVAKNRSALPDMTYWLLDGKEFPVSKTTETRSFDKGKPKGGGVFNWENHHTKEFSEGESHERERDSERETDTDNDGDFVDFDLFIPSYNPAAERINKFLEQKIPMGVREYTWVSNVVEEFSEEKIMEAIGIGLKAKSEGRLKVPLLKYVAAILKRWYEERVIDEEEARLAEEKAEHMRPGVLTRQIGEMMHK